MPLTTSNVVKPNDSVFDWESQNANAAPGTLGSVKKNIGQIANVGANIGGWIQNLGFGNAFTNDPKKQGVVTTPPVAATPQGTMVGAVKSHTMSPDGSVSVTYHKPADNTSVTQPAQNTNLFTPNVDASRVDSAGSYVTPSAAPTNGTFAGAVGGLANTDNSSALQKQAADIASSAGQTISDIGRAGARGAAGYRTTGTSPVGEGNAAILNQSTAAQQNAVAQGANVELAGIDKGLTAQGLIQGAQSAAGTLSAPAQVPYNSQFLNPVTGQPINPSGSQGLSDAVALQVQKIRNGTTDPASAASALSAYGQAGTNALQQALGPNFNLNIASGSANAQGEVAATQAATVQTFKSALQQGQNLQAQLKDLITTFGLNPNDINAANKGIQLVAQNTSSPQYKILSNYVNDIANTYAQILTPPGGSQTDTTRALATSMLDATSKGTSIIDVMKSLDAAANAKIAGVSTLNNNQSGGGLYDF